MSGDEISAALVVAEESLIAIVVDGRLDRGAETGAHVDPLCTERQRGDQAAPVTQAA